MITIMHYYYIILRLRLCIVEYMNINILLFDLYKCVHMYAQYTFYIKSTHILLNFTKCNIIKINFSFLDFHNAMLQIYSLIRHQIILLLSNYHIGISLFICT